MVVVWNTACGEARVEVVTFQRQNHQGLLVDWMWNVRKKDKGFGPSSGRNGISHVLRLGEEQV